MIFIDAMAGIDALLVIGLEGERLRLFEGRASGKVIFKIMLEYGARREGGKKKEKTIESGKHR